MRPRLGQAVAQLDLERRQLELGRLRLRHLSGARRHAVLGSPLEQPVTQPAGALAVVAVVVTDLVQQLRGTLGIAAVAGLAVGVVLDDRCRGVGHLALTQVVAHVERLELLDAVRRRGDPDRAADDGVQVDQDACGEKLVDGGLAGRVLGREPQQCGLLVRRVVVDVQVGMLLAAHPDELDEVLERLLLLRPVVGPERRERRLGAGLGHLGDTEEILQAPPVGVPVVPHRVTLEVEEQVAGRRSGDHGEVVGAEDVGGDGRVPRCHRRPGARPAHGAW